MGLTMRMQRNLYRWTLRSALGLLLLTAAACARHVTQPPATPQPPAPAEAAPAEAQSPEAQPAPQLVIEPKAVDILKAASRKLAAAHTMRLTAVTSYENPSRLGPPLLYTTKSEITLQRPNKLRVITPADGPASEFYYDGKTMMAFAPAENLVAVAEAPPTIDAALKAAYDSAAIYFPFSDVIVADPYGDLSEALTLAFYIGQSKVVGGTTTDMIAYITGDVFVQAWIGAQDKLPRRLRAVYRDDPVQLRHQVDLSDWQLDPTLPAGTFTSARARRARRIEFARPDPQRPPGAGVPPKAESKPKSKGTETP